jgi:hypothetical protein
MRGMGNPMGYGMPPEHYPFGMPAPSHHMPPMFFQHPPPSYLYHQRPPFKRYLERFLLESSYTEKSTIRKAMYNLMTFIDRNFEALSDPRAKDRIFLSYCDEFDHTFMGPLVQEHISKLSQKKDKSEDKFATADL